MSKILEYSQTAERLPIPKKDTLMYFDQRLWELTRGLRGRIGLAILIGVVASLFGIARFRPARYVIARVFAGDGWAIIALLPLGWRGRCYCAPCSNISAPFLHTDCLLVQEDLRGKLYDRSRTRPGLVCRGAPAGSCCRLSTASSNCRAFWAVPAAGLRRGADADRDLRLYRLVGRASRWVMLVAALVTWSHRWCSTRSRAAAADCASGDERLRLRVPRRGAGPADPQGVRPEQRLWKAPRDRARLLSETTMRVLSTSVMTRGITDAGIAIGAAWPLALGVWRVSNGLMTIEALLIVLMAGTKCSAATRPALGPAPGHGRSIGRGGHPCLLASEPLVPAQTKAVVPARLVPTIAFDDVHFAYPAGAGRRMTGCRSRSAPARRSVSSARAAQVNPRSRAVAAAVRSAIRHGADRRPGYAPVDLSGAG